MLHCAIAFVCAAVAPQDAPAPPVAAATYDPLRLPEQRPEPGLALSVHDAARERDIPLRVHLPTLTDKAPVVLCSHGLGGTRDTCTYLARHWAARGYVAVFLQHPGSDDSVWKGTALGERMAAMTKAASGQNLLLRCADVTAVLDQLAIWNAEAGHALAGRLDLEHVGMSGHSFGAVTTQAVSGQVVPLYGQRLTDARIDAALPMSPSSPALQRPAVAFGKVRIPWLLMTGTHDVAPIGDVDVASRLAVYPALPATIDRCELVLHEAEHSAFTERALPGDERERNPNHHRVILALSTAFWDAHLRSDAAARAWLHGSGPRSVMQERDRWQCAAASTAAK